MIEINAKLPASFSQRCRSLNIAAHAVRERAVARGCDLDGWRLSRLMREASTDAQVNVAERRFRRWLRAIPLVEVVRRDDPPEDKGSFQRSPASKIQVRSANAT